MKKKYSTPRIVFDSFELSESIATNCAYISQQAYGVCPVTLEEAVGIIVFGDSSVCMNTVDPNDESNNHICYHGPIDQYKVFSS